MSKSMSYDKAYEELQQIVEEMEGDDITVDQLSEKVKRASELLKICKKKLTETELDVQKILKEMENSEGE